MFDMTNCHMFVRHCHRTRFRDSFCLASVFEMTVYLLTYLLRYYRFPTGVAQHCLANYKQLCNFGHYPYPEVIFYREFIGNFYAGMMHQQVFCCSSCLLFSYIICCYIII